MTGVLRRTARSVFAPDTRFLLQTEWNQLRDRGAATALRWNAMLSSAWLRDRVNRRRYRLLGEEELRRSRKSDRVFVFGSGWSLNELAPDEWLRFAQDDVLGFNAFYFQRWVPVDFHVLRVGVYGELRWRAHAEEIRNAIQGNALFAQTVFVVQEGYLAQLGNQLVGYGMLPPGARVFRYRSARTDGPPSRSFREGLRHTSGTLADAVNFAYCNGWTQIVLVGVDLYDSRYFYLQPDQTVGFDEASGRMVPAERNYWRGQRYSEPHATARAGVVSVMSSWRAALAADGVSLEVYNPRSLLAEVLPVYAHRPEPPA